jgi:hypothetical protein
MGQFVGSQPVSSPYLRINLPHLLPKSLNPAGTALFLGGRRDRFADRHHHAGATDPVLPDVQLVASDDHRRPDRNLRSRR